MSFIDGGQYYGYPNCCIEQFIGRFVLIQTGIISVHVAASVSKDKIWDGTGFLPCKKCQEQITDQASLDDFVRRVIAPKRKCPTAFPKDDAQ